MAKGKNWTAYVKDTQVNDADRYVDSLCDTIIEVCQKVKQANQKGDLHSVRIKAGYLDEKAGKLVDELLRN